eukprot:gene14987-10722_t
MLSSSMLLSLVLVVAMLCAADAFSSKASVGGLTTKRLSLSRWMQPAMKNQKMLETIAAIRGGAEGRVQVLTEPKALQQLLDTNKSNGKVVVLDFTASWCGPCQRIAPVYAQLSTTEEFQNVIFLKIDVDEAADIAQEYGVSAMPTFLIWKNGKVQEKVMGANAPALVQSIRKFL